MRKHIVLGGLAALLLSPNGMAQEPNAKPTGARVSCTATPANINNRTPDATSQLTVSVNEECRRRLNWVSPTTVTVRKAPTHGNVTLEGSTGLIYKPEAGYRGGDNFVIAVKWASGQGTITYEVTVK